ncbi:MAG TPA: hypothetical protein PLO61_00070 [Fimbriimonadaceae bacterium]|nr:hypothetical protein [Fimbriimonadaceae bacterium]HRJ33523.1 hypothetical protein [Fimbriimonadaceae bacterium]
MEKIVLAIDPGSSKIGMALVLRDAAGKLNLLWRCVAPQEELLSRVQEASEQRPFSMIIIGSGTRSKETVLRVREAFPSVGILVVDEKDTSMQARERYWEFHRRRGWRKLFPATMQVPPVPVDDFVAFILAERVLGDA